jgi:hypothetical protein
MGRACLAGYIVICCGCNTVEIGGNSACQIAEQLAPKNSAGVISRI